MLGKKNLEERLKHLNSTLRVIRIINQLITKEKDKEKLIQGICKSLTKERGYYSAWIALMDEQRKLKESVESGVGKDFKTFTERIGKGKFTNCWEKAMSGSSIVINKKPKIDCGDCPLAGGYGNRGAMTVKLEHSKKVCGILSVSIPLKYIEDREEQKLFAEVAKDISFALYSIEQEEERKKAEKKYRTIFENTGTAVAIIEDDTTISLVNSFFEKISGYSKSEIENKKSWTEFVVDKDLDRMKKYHYGRRAGKKNVPESYEFRFVDKSGDVKDVFLAISMIPETKKSVASIINVTNRKKAEQALKASKEKYANLIRSSPAGIITIDTKGNITSCNKRILDFTGYTRNELAGTNFTRLKILKVKDIAKLLKMLAQAIKGKKIQKFDLSWQHKNGTSYICETRYSSIKEKGKIIGFQIIVTDITEMKKVEKALKASEREFRELFARISSSVAVYEAVDDGEDFIFKDFNKASEKINKIKKKDIIGRSVLKVFPGVRKSGLFDVFKRVYKTGKPEYRPISFYKDNRISAWSENYVYKLPSGEVVAVYDDVTNRKKAEENLKYLSFHDKLTGLYNRASFEEELVRLNTPRQLPISIAMGDANALKLINDAFGYRQGDRLLVRIAKILKKCCRKEDIIARWGGDEFIALLPKTTEEDAIKLLDRIRGACQSTIGQKIPVSVSIDISTKTKKSQNIQDIVKEAEDRMHQRKLIESRNIQNSIVSSLEATLWERSHETEEHGERLKRLALKLGRTVRLAPNKLDELELLSTLHDIGKIGIEDNILTKPGKLTKKEWKAIRRHPEIGYKIAQSSPQLLRIADGILYHHEWWDGTGYPSGLKGENIPVVSRILAIVDAYDVMTHSRVYKKVITKDEAIEELKRCSGTQFDPKLIDKFIDIIG